MSKRTADNIRTHRCSGYKAGFIQMFSKMRLNEEETGQDIVNQIGHMHILWLVL